ncbi:hypothetical protein FH589_00435 [Leptospira interrogans]|uniref:Uncharacterized protein n=1 Tax=Leptospira interrogans serovar Manilae TaxID=214675 RepID=A0AAQ1SQR6_LEPIR|nr:hypothetical protein [Leptospira interrogans]KAA1264058.1 hypothetical protein C5473_20385 [Leptospira interrogans serovar Weerasinghe]KAA1293667.1 hypothetical protein C4X99_00865 [Leptospira interrogans serovar Geyaweera]AKP28115.1 hypothetical protein LIMLP_18950 [Leptospira interrogans serovar Manilae]AKP31897.1 hypothetical protein LIMHP_18955 [Leptospira interrogans serovar Manilae]EYU63917.1 hypothetical protein CI00_10495 [Leptospira interrogans serovar Manilae]
MLKYSLELIPKPKKESNLNKAADFSQIDLLQKRKRFQKILFGFVFILVTFSQNCVRPEVVSASDSQSQIYAAANYLSNKCGNPIPVPMPIVVDDIQQRNLDLCTIAITRSECPFISYPFACVLIYVEEPIGEIPWYLDFQEVFVKTKIQ